MTSYFLCGDAAEAYPQMILDGDRNIGNSQSPHPDSLPRRFTLSEPTMWLATSQVVARRNLTLPLPCGAGPANDLHQKAGNLGIADGSVQQVTCSGLMTSLLNATNGAATVNPVYNIP